MTVSLPVPVGPVTLCGAPELDVFALAALVAHCQDVPAGALYRQALAERVHDDAELRGALGALDAGDWRVLLPVLSRRFRALSPGVQARACEEMHRAVVLHDHDGHDPHERGSCGPARGAGHVPYRPLHDPDPLVRALVAALICSGDMRPASPYRRDLHEALAEAGLTPSGDMRDTVRLLRTQASRAQRDAAHQLLADFTEWFGGLVPALLARA